jgi:prepilin-type N-terminal cleavage/methylation domain-containing protein
MKPSAPILIGKRSTNSLSGFTLVELLVTIVIIVVLAALALLGLGHFRLSANKAVSVNNIRSLSAVTMVSAADNNGRFLGIHSSANLPYRFTRSFRDQYGISKQNAYSNANNCWKADGWDHCQNRDLWDFNAGDTVFGYACMVDDSPTLGASGWATGKFEYPDNWDRIKDRVSSPNGQEGTTIRWVAKRTTDEAAYPILWMDLCRVFQGQIVGNFMGSDNKPLGVHVGYMDGRVEWKPGKYMKVRYRGSANLLW